MKPTLTPTELAQPLTWTTTINTTRANKTLALNLPVLDATLAVDGKSKIPERLTIKLTPDHLPTHPYAPLAAYGQRIHPTITITTRHTTQTIPLGQYQIQTWTEQTDGTIQVEAHGLLQTIADAPWPTPTSPTPGTTLQQEAARITAPLPVKLARGCDDPVLKRGIAWGNDRLDALHDLGDSHGVRWVVLSDGVVWGIPKRSGRDVVRTYRGRDLALEMLRSGDHSRANAVSVVRRQGSGEDETVSVRTASNNYPPYDEDGYGVVRKVVDSESAASLDQMQAHAEKLLAEERAAGVVRQVEIVADPGIELWDVVAVELGDEIVVGAVQAYTLPVSSGGSMRLDLQELTY